MSIQYISKRILNCTNGDKIMYEEQAKQVQKFSEKLEKLRGYL